MKWADIDYIFNKEFSIKPDHTKSIIQGNFYDANGNEISGATITPSSGIVYYPSESGSSLESTNSDGDFVVINISDGANLTITASSTSGSITTPQFTLPEKAAYYKYCSINLE